MSRFLSAKILNQVQYYDFILIILKLQYLIIFYPRPRVFSGIVFSAMTIGQTMSMLPDYGKAKASAFKLFKLIREPPLIDAYSKEGKKVSLVLYLMNN